MKKTHKLLALSVLLLFLWGCTGLTGGYQRRNIATDMPVMTDGQQTLYVYSCLPREGYFREENGTFCLAENPYPDDTLTKCAPGLRLVMDAWRINLEGPNGPLIRMAGGIPIPVDNLAALKKFKVAMDEVLQSKTWLHFYPEGSMWMFYPDVRPFKKAVFQYAVRYDRPIIPMGFSFRPRKGITRLFTKVPAVDLHIGAPLFPDKSLSPVEATRKLQKEAYHVIQGLCDIHPGDPNYRVDQDPANYQKTM